MEELMGGGGGFRSREKHGICTSESISFPFLFLTSLCFFYALFCEKAINTMFDQLNNMVCTTSSWNSRSLWLKVRSSQGNSPYSTLISDSASLKLTQHLTLICLHRLKSVYPLLSLFPLFWPQLPSHIFCPVGFISSFFPFFPKLVPLFSSSQLEYSHSPSLPVNKDQNKTQQQ